MVNAHRNLLKFFLVLIISVTVFFCLLLVVISPLAKYLIEKYDDLILGRKIEISWIYVNPLTGYVHIKDLRVYEYKSDSLFFAAPAVSARFNMFKLLHKTYEISYITIYKPWGRIIQDKHAINFQDIIDHYRRKHAKPADDTIPTHFNILNCEIVDGEFHYDERSLPVTYFIKHVNIKSPGKWWNRDSMFFKVGLESGPYTGIINGTFLLNFKSLDYRIVAEVDTFNLKPLSQYMRALSNYGNYGGFLKSNVHLDGNFKDKMALRAWGIIDIIKLHFGPREGEDYGSFQHLILDLKEADPGHKKYLINSFMLDRPYFRYERYDHLDNLTLMFSQKVTDRQGVKADQGQFNLVIEIAEYLNELARNFAQSYYKINKFTIYKGDLIYNDYTLREKFTIEAMPVGIRADSVDRHYQRINLAVNGAVKPYGQIDLGISLDPNDYGYFDVKYKVTKVPVSLFNPYLITYTSFPLDRGTLLLNGDWSVADSIIKSNNHLLVMDPRVGERIKASGTRWAPMPFIMSLVRQPGEAIEYDVPVSGNLTKPEFSFVGAIKTTLANIFFKPITTPYLVTVVDLENAVEKMLMLKWEMRQTSLNRIQQKFVNKIARFLKQHPDYKITVSSQVFTDKEKEHIEFFEIKKKYLLSTLAKNRVFNTEDSIHVENMYIKDSLVLKYLNRLTADSVIYTVQQKCRHVLGDNFINARLKDLLTARENVFLEPFRQNGTATQVKFGKPEAGIPFNGYSRYKIDYNGNVPEELRQDYDEMERLNSQELRAKFKSARWLPTVKGILPVEK